MSTTVRKDGVLNKSINDDLSPVRQASTPAELNKKNAKKVLFLKEKVKPQTSSKEQNTEKRIADLVA